MDHRPPPEGAYRPSRFVQGNLETGVGVEAVEWDSLDAVFHLAAAGVKAAAREWPICIKVNVLGTLRLLEFLEQSVSAPALIYTHTFYEDFLATTPSLVQSPYVLSKFTASQVVRQFARHYRGPVVTAKVFQIYGPGDASGNLIPYALANLRRGEVVQVGSGLGLRDWLNVSDVLTGLVAAWHSGMPRKLRAFDLGSGELVTIRDVLLRLATLLGQPASLLDFDPSRDRGDTALVGKAETWPDHWHPQATLDQGLRTLISPPSS
jgi:nucleoside-diphosphate-sugar epimerase